jgi:hypothetical protein
MVSNPQLFCKHTYEISGRRFYKNSWHTVHTCIHCKHEYLGLEK